MNEAVFSRSNRAALHQDVYQTLKSAILKGRLQSGTRLREAEIAAQIGTSRAPIREALRQLEHEGLVVNSPYKGTFVAVFTPRDIRELCSVRSLLEGRAVAEAMKRITPADLERLAKIMDEMSAVARKDMELWEFVEKDLAFHEEICRLSGNERLFRIWSTLASQTLLYLVMVTEAYLDREAVARTHVPAFEAIRAGDTGRAQAALQYAIESVGEDMARRLEQAHER